jgi:hypothetical protein
MTAGYPHRHCTSEEVGWLDGAFQQDPPTTARGWLGTVHRRQASWLYRAKYDWNVTVAGGQFDAPYSAPTAGPPPYQPYEIRPTTVFGLVNDSALGPSSTRWRF